MATRRSPRNPISKIRAIRRRENARPDRVDAEVRTVTSDRIVYIVGTDRDRRVHLARFLRSRGLQTEAFGCSGDFFEALSYLAPGCALIVSDPEGQGGVEIIPLVREVRPEMMSILMAADPSVRTVVRALKQGAVSVLDLPFDEYHTLAALDEVFLALPAHVARERQRGEALALIQTLSPRENEVFRAIVEGATNRQISFSLALSDRTVEMHRANVMRKLGMNNVAALARFAVMVGIVEFWRM